MWGNVNVFRHTHAHGVKSKKCLLIVGKQALVLVKHGGSKEKYIVF